MFIMGYGFAMFKILFELGKNTSFFVYFILGVASSTLQHLYLLVIFDKIFEKKILGKIDNK
tara:strand:- start:686 stop:868 length:183 start_codon:yes stop_codon:yes gene_type:complete